MIAENVVTRVNNIKWHIELPLDIKHVMYFYHHTPADMNNNVNLVLLYFQDYNKKTGDPFRNHKRQLSTVLNVHEL